MSKSFERTSELDLFSQIRELHLEKNGLKSVPQNPGEVLKQFSRINENELSLCADILTKIVKVILEESPHILIK